MQPIVDGLEIEYQETVAFIQINASTAQGSELFNAYNLLGHPSYLILGETGEVLWQGLGEQPAENIQNALDTALVK